MFQGNHIDLANGSFGSGSGRLSLGLVKFGSLKFCSDSSSVRVKFGLDEVRVDQIWFRFGFCLG